MPLKFSFETDCPQLAALIREVAEKTMPSEAAKAINRTMTFIRNDASEGIARETGIKKTLIRRRIKSLQRRRASPKNLAAHGFMGEATFPVGKLTPKPRKLRGGVKYKTAPGQTVDPKAFYAVMPSGHKSAFARKGAARKPIKEIQVNITTQMRRHLKRVLNTTAPEFMERTFFENMEKRVKRDTIRAGLKNR